MRISVRRTSSSHNRGSLSSILRPAISATRLQKVPYMLIVGDREETAGEVAVRLRSGEDLGSISMDELRARILSEAALGGRGPD